jgi:hypothetical protein
MARLPTLTYEARRAVDRAAGARRKGQHHAQSAERAGGLMDHPPMRLWGYPAHQRGFLSESCCCWRTSCGLRPGLAAFGAFLAAPLSRPLARSPIIALLFSSAYIGVPHTVPVGGMVNSFPGSRSASDTTTPRHGCSAGNESRGTSDALGRSSGLPAAMAPVVPAGGLIGTSGR